VSSYIFHSPDSFVVGVGCTVQCVLVVSKWNSPEGLLERWQLLFEESGPVRTCFLSGAPSWSPGAVYGRAGSWEEAGVWVAWLAHSARPA
jgi:hypothetical protein